MPRHSNAVLKCPSSRIIIVYLTAEPKCSCTDKLNDPANSSVALLEQPLLSEPYKAWLPTSLLCIAQSHVTSNCTAECWCIDLIYNKSEMTKCQWSEIPTIPIYIVYRSIACCYPRNWYWMKKYLHDINGEINLLRSLSYSSYHDGKLQQCNCNVDTLWGSYSSSSIPLDYSSPETEMSGKTASESRERVNIPRNNEKFKKLANIWENKSQSYKNKQTKLKSFIFQETHWKKL